MRQVQHSHKLGWGDVLDAPHPRVIKARHAPMARAFSFYSTLVLKSISPTLLPFRKRKKTSIGQITTKILRKIRFNKFGFWEDVASVKIKFSTLLPTLLPDISFNKNNTTPRKIVPHLPRSTPISKLTKVFREAAINKSIAAAINLFCISILRTILLSINAYRTNSRRRRPLP